MCWEDMADRPGGDPAGGPVLSGPVRSLPARAKNMYAARGRDLVIWYPSSPPIQGRAQRETGRIWIEVGLLVLVAGHEQGSEHGSTAQDGRDPSRRSGQGQKTEGIGGQQAVGVVDGLGHDHAEHAGYTG